MVDALAFTFLLFCASACRMEMYRAMPCLPELQEEGKFVLQTKGQPTPSQTGLIVLGEVLHGQAQVGDALVVSWSKAGKSIATIAAIDVKDLSGDDWKSSQVACAGSNVRVTVGQADFSIERGRLAQFVFKDGYEGEALTAGKTFVAKMFVYSGMELRTGLEVICCFPSSVHVGAKLKQIIWADCDAEEAETQKGKEVAGTSSGMAEKHGHTHTGNAQTKADFGAILKALQTKIGAEKFKQVVLSLRALQAKKRAAKHGNPSADEVSSAIIDVVGARVYASMTPEQPPANADDTDKTTKKCKGELKID